MTYPIYIAVMKKLGYLQFEDHLVFFKVGKGINSIIYDPSHYYKHLQVLFNKEEITYDMYKSAIKGSLVGFEYYHFKDLYYMDFIKVLRDFYLGRNTEKYVYYKSLYKTLIESYEKV